MKRVRKEQRTLESLFYDKLHVRNTQYTNLEDLVVRRMKVLRLLESFKSGVSLQDISDQWEDVESHFYCRLLCSQALWSVKWFVGLETQLFRKRLLSYESEKVGVYFKESFLRRLEGIDTDKNLILPHSSLLMKERGPFEYNSDLKVHFTKVYDLVATRRVKLDRGYCKINPEVMRSCLNNFYRQFLEEKMYWLYEYMLRTPDERLKKLHERIFSEKKPISAPTTIEDSHKYLPPCISKLINKLKKTRHIKYNDRQTLCLFLKDTGVSVEENIQFMRSAFDVTKSVFDKEYLYGIRHNYGLEGKKANYSSFTCKKIISMSREPNTCGCPFTNDLDGLSEYMASKGVECPEIENMIKNSGCQEACSSVLAKILDKNHAATISSPVDFYREYRADKQ